MREGTIDHRRRKHALVIGDELAAEFLLEHLRSEGLQLASEILLGEARTLVGGHLDARPRWIVPDPTLIEEALLPRRCAQGNQTAVDVAMAGLSAVTSSSGTRAASSRMIMRAPA